MKHYTSFPRVRRIGQYAANQRTAGPVNIKLRQYGIIPIDFESHDWSIISEQKSPEMLKKINVQELNRSPKFSFVSRNIAVHFFDLYFLQLLSFVPLARIWTSIQVNFVVTYPVTGNFFCYQDIGLSIGKLCCIKRFEIPLSFLVCHKSLYSVSS